MMKAYLRKAVLPFAAVMTLFLLPSQSVTAQSLDFQNVLWCDPLLNIRRIYNVRNISAILNNADRSGFEAIALGVKALTGEVIYESKIAPRLLEWKDYRVPLNFDPVETFLDEAHRRGLRVYAVFNVFAEGQMVYRKGPVYDEHRNWQTHVYVVERDEPQVMPITEWAYGSVAFANPLMASVQDYQISVVEEFLKEYKVDGVIFDRVRFSGIESDFSDEAKRMFENSLGQGQTISWWPNDVYELQFRNEKWEVVPNKYFQRWIEFRAKRIQQFFQKLTKKVRDVNRTLLVGNAVGAWYPTYYEYGVNWASPDYRSDEEWATSEYQEASILESIDYLIAGCYFPRLTMNESENIGAEWWMSVEGAAIMATEAVNEERPVYGSIWAEQFKNTPETFTEALKTAVEQTDGLFVYDVSHIEDHGLWDEITSVLRNVQ